MPRGFSPIFSVATTLSVAVSMTETDAAPSLETYARGPAAAGTQYVQPASAVVSRSRGKFIGAERNGSGVELYERASVNYPTRICMPLIPQLLAIFAVGASSLCHAADFTAAQVRDLLATADRNTPVDLAGKDLSDLDLNDIDFKRANLSGANPFGARLVSSNLAGAKLVRANLNGAWLMGTKFAGADLSGSTMLGLVILGGTVKEKPNFAGANLSGVRLIADLPGTDLRGADLSRSKLGVDIRNQGMGQMRTDLSGANLAGADLHEADLNRALLMFADLKGANLKGANLFRAKLSGADLTGADVAAADFTEADLEGTVFRDVKGLDATKGMDTATNRDKAIY